MPASNAYYGGIKLKDLDGRDRGAIDIRGGGIMVTLTVMLNGEVGSSQQVVDLFDDADVLDLCAGLRDALGRKHELQAQAGGPV